MGTVALSIVEKALEWAFRHFTAINVCWLCVCATLAGGWFFATRYATAGEVNSVRTELLELKADAITKRIFDYRVRQCDTPADLRQEKRWLAEQIRVDAEKYRKLTDVDFAIPACGDL
jgi:hypothetical protein